MDFFNFNNGRLHAEDIEVAEIAQAVGTPCYIYSRATIERHWNVFDGVFGEYPHQICYAVKANSNIAILNILARLGSGFDIVSGGELYKVIEAGGDPGKTIFSGVCKLDWEIAYALEKGVSAFNIESEGELEKISTIAESMGKRVNISVRINPDVDANTHPYISTGLRNNKFGLAPDRAFEIYLKAAKDKNLNIHGVACHIGSQLMDLAPYADALSGILVFVDRLECAGIEIKQIDFGGGLGVRYSDEQPPSPKEYWDIIHQQLAQRKNKIDVAIEPGRAIVGNAGILVTRVHYLKQGEFCSFCMVDAGMNDLIRPALYQAYQDIIEVDQNKNIAAKTYDVVGPVCESSDFLGKERRLRVSEQDLLAIRTSGAYCSVMSSNYNSRMRPAEVMVDGDQYHTIKHRESMESLVAGEERLPE